METEFLLNCLCYVAWDMENASFETWLCVGLLCKQITLGANSGPETLPCFTHHLVLQGSSTASLEDQRGGILCSGIHTMQVFEPLQPFSQGESLRGVSEGRQHKQEPYLVSSFWTIEKDFQCKALLRGFFHADSGITAIKSFSQQGC